MITPSQIGRGKRHEYVQKALADLVEVTPGQQHADEIAKNDMRRRHRDLVDDAGKAKRFQQQYKGCNDRYLIEPQPAHAPFPVRPIVFRDSSRSVFHRRLVRAPKFSRSTIRLSRSRGQFVSTRSIVLPGRADITTMRSASIAASSSACVIRKTVAPVSRHNRNISSPISSRVCWSSAPKGSSSRMRRGSATMRTRNANALAHAA